MGERRDTDLSEIAWPGFVDILSAVIIMFVFFLLIVATALYFHIIIFKSQILAPPEDHQQKIVSEEEEVISQMQSEFAESLEQTVKVDSSSDELVVFFGSDSISVKKETVDEIRGHLDQYKQNPDKYRISILSAKNPNTYETAARKVAVARMLNVRNVFLTEGFPSSSIHASVVEAEEIDDNIHWVKIVFEEK